MTHHDDDELVTMTRGEWRRENRWRRTAVTLSIVACIVTAAGAWALISARFADAERYARITCANAVANRLVARDADVATVNYVRDVVEIVGEYAGIPDELADRLERRRLERLDEIERERPELDPTTCPPVPLTTPGGT